MRGKKTQLPAIFLFYLPAAYKQDKTKKRKFFPITKKGFPNCKVRKSFFILQVNLRLNPAGAAAFAHQCKLGTGRAFYNPSDFLFTGQGWH